MMLRLAVRNLLRNTRRTVLSLAAVVAGVGVLVLGQGFIGGMEENAIRAVVDTSTGHVLLRPAGYPTEGLQHPVDDLFQSPVLPAELAASVEASAPRLLFIARAIHGPDAMRIRAIGFDPERDATVFSRGTWHVDGATPKSAADGVLLGAGVARNLRAKTGDTIVLQARTRAGAINALELKVAGVVATGAPFIDQTAVMMAMDQAQTLVIADGAVSHFAVRLHDRDDATAFVQRWTAPAGTEATTWIAETAAVLRIQSIRRAALNLLVAALLGMSAAGIANTILMAAYERVREVGTLRALGFTRRDVLALFVLEGAMMGAIGALLGAALGGGVVYHYHQVGIDLSGLIEQTGGNLPIAAMLYTDWSPPTVAGAVAFGTVIAMLASVYPAHVASRMVPADAVRA